MSLTSALNNAITGLAATSRGTQLVADNLSNAQTADFGRREIRQQANSLGGVRIDGIARVIKAGVLAEMRSANAERENSSTRLEFLKQAESLIGIPGAPRGIGTALTEFRSALIEAGAPLADEGVLTKLAGTARTLAVRLNDASNGIQAQRMKAERAISADVAQLNKSLESVASLNRRIAVAHSTGDDSSVLMDQRQTAINRINEIVPIRVVPRDGEIAALFAVNGAVLLDGTTPEHLKFTRARHIEAGEGGLNSLVVNGRTLDEAQLDFYGGGRLAANFEIRDRLAPHLQADLDVFALELYDRLANAQADPTISAGKPGIFTDGETDSTPDLNGLSSRIQLHHSIDPDYKGEVWRLRDGLYGFEEGPKGDATQFARMLAALDHLAPAANPAALTRSADLSNHLAALESRVSTARVNLEAENMAQSTRADTITTQFLADGVDSDLELQKLTIYEQSYAANALLVRAVGEMMDQILRW